MWVWNLLDGFLWDKARIFWGKLWEIFYWEQRQLKKMAVFEKGQGYSKKDLVKYGYKIILYGRMYTNYQTIIEDIDTCIENDDNCIRSKPGDIIVPASGESPDDIARASVVPYGGIILGGDLNIIEVNKKALFPIFVALSLSYGKVKKELSSRAQGKSIVHLRNKDLESINIFFPSLDEQKKISSLIIIIENTITLHERKLDALNNLKKEFLRVLFTSGNETKPKLRFRNFNCDWKLLMLGELASIVRGASPRPIQDPKWFDDKSDIGWLRIADVTEQEGRIYHLKQHISMLAQEKTRVLTEPHLLLSIAATVGKPVVNYVKTGVHDGFLIFLQPNFNLEFMFQWLEMFQPKWQKYGQPGSQVNLNSELVKKSKHNVTQ